METQLLTYVSSYGIDPFTGETFPEGSPKYRSVSQIYSLLSMGYTVEERIGNGVAVELNLHQFLQDYHKEIYGNVHNQKPEKKNREGGK